LHFEERVVTAAGGADMCASARATESSMMSIICRSRSEVWKIGSCVEERADEEKNPLKGQRSKYISEAGWSGRILLGYVRTT
jgi:hypothetical protein